VGGPGVLGAVLGLAVRRHPGVDAAPDDLVPARIDRRAARIHHLAHDLRAHRPDGASTGVALLLNDMRPQEYAVVQDGHAGVGHLNRRRLEIALADAVRVRVALEPRLPRDRPLLPAGVRDEARNLARQSQPGNSAQAELARVVGEGFVADPVPLPERLAAGKL